MIFLWAVLILLAALLAINNREFIAFFGHVALLIGYSVLGFIVMGPGLAIILAIMRVLSV